MISYETPYRVCYADTDRMGIMYYGNYPRLYEIGRTDMIRTIWKSYREVEESGIILPVRLLHAIYHKPANYDELLTIRTIIKEIPKVKFRLISEIYNEKMELINEGEVTLGFMDAASGKPRRAPAEFTEILERTGKFEGEEFINFQKKPNAETNRAISDVKKGKVIESENVEEMMKKLNS